MKRFWEGRKEGRKAVEGVWFGLVSRSSALHLTVTVTVQQGFSFENPWGLSFGHKGLRF